MLKSSNLIRKTLLFNSSIRNSYYKKYTTTAITNTSSSGSKCSNINNNIDLNSYEKSLESTRILLNKIRSNESFISDNNNKTESLNAAKTEPSKEIITDTFGRVHTYLRISLTERCNLRCQYCMPEEGVPLQPANQILTNDEIIRLAKLFVASGVTKIRFTGGEPLVRKDIEPLIEEIGKIEGLKTIAMTTNGIALNRKLERLHRAGLNLLNISLDTLDTNKFTIITRRLGWEKVMESIEKALALNFNPVKINCVIMRDINDYEICDFVEMTRNKPIEIRFIEYMPFDGNRWSDKKFVSFKEMLQRIKNKFGSIEKIPEDHPNNTSKTYQVPGFVGKVGFITSMSEHFCNSCNRLRITADGNLKVCLFGNAEVSLRDFMRVGATDEDLLKVINAAVLKKKESHAVIQKINQSIKLFKSVFIPNSFINSSSKNNYGSNNHRNNQHLQSIRYYSSANGKSDFTHIDNEKKLPTMVDVSEKVVTKRTATARALIEFPEFVLNQLAGGDKDGIAGVGELQSKKGPVFATSIVAGTMAVKNTSNMIPFCHPLPIESCKFNIDIISKTTVQVDCTVSVSHKTGVEMEALTGASVASLCIYDMCKALSHSIVIKEVKLLSKTGGKSDVTNK